MDVEKLTDRARGFVQSAQSLALREGHQQFTPAHLLKVLLDDPEGLAAGLIDRSGGRSREALAAVEAALAKRPKVSGGGLGPRVLKGPERDRPAPFGRIPPHIPADPAELRRLSSRSRP